MKMICEYCESEFDRVGRSQAARRHCSDWCRFWAKVDASGDCWEWTASLNGAGYGQFMIAELGRPVGAHRWMWESFVGEIPAGYHVDHLCRNRKCVNIAHLEPVPVGVNLKRGNMSRPQTRCKRGHPLEGRNAARGSGTRRYCRKCANAARREWRKRIWDKEGRRA